MPDISALLVGVSNPAPFTWTGTSPSTNYAPRPLPGVDEDIENVSNFLGGINGSSLKEPKRTAIEAALIRKVQELEPGGILVAYFTGHGARLQERGGTFNEVFLASDGPLLDGVLRSVWRRRTDITVVGIADVCHAQRILINMLPPGLSEEPFGTPCFGAPLGYNLGFQTRQVQFAQAVRPQQAVSRFASSNSANLLLLSAARSEEDAYAKPNGSLFTRALSKACLLYTSPSPRD